MALHFAKSDALTVVSGLILVSWKIPAALMIRYGVHATNHREIVIRAI